MGRITIIISVIENVLVGAEVTVTDLAGKSSVIINVKHPFLGLLQKFFSQIIKAHGNKSSNEIVPYSDKIEPKIEVGPNILLPNNQLPEDYDVQLCEEGVNGTYFIRDSNGQSIGIFKPQDEEANSDNSPKKNLNSSSGGLIEGLLPGEAASREIAAFLLDKDGFYDVPPTYFVTLSHPNFFDPKRENNEPKVKTGSYQCFVENDCSAWDIGSSIFPVHEVHKVGILDLQIFNVDRHGGNILVQKTTEGVKLIPIDNGYSLPDKLNPRMWFEWMNWNQSKVPFSEKSKAIIEAIDLESNLEMLKNTLNIRPECLNMMKIGTNLLKKGASKNLSLYHIGSIVCRVLSPDQPSALELMFEQAKVQSSGDEKVFFQTLYSLMDEEIARLQSNLSGN